MDKILINDLRVNAIIGVNENERLMPQEILINVTIHTDTKAVAASDNLLDNVDYSLIAKEMRSKAISVKRFTLEALAEDIALVCLGNIKVQKVIVRVEKPSALEDARSAGIEIERP